MPATAASCAYLMSRKDFILLHVLYAALARAHLEQGIQFGSPPFGRDIKRLETTNVEECRRWQGERGSDSMLSSLEARKISLSLDCQRANWGAQLLT